MIGRVIRKSPAYRTAPSIYAAEVGKLPYYSEVEVISVIVEQAGVKEWAELGGRYAGYFTAILYPTTNWLGVKTNTTHVQINPLPYTYGRVLHDHEIWGMDRVAHHYKERGEKIPPKFQDRRGDPETVKLMNSQHVVLTPKLQLLWANLLKEAAPNYDYKQAFRSLTKGDRCYTNKAGWNNGYADYINHVNTDNQGIRFEPIITGGNHVVITGKKFRKYGGEWYPILTFDVRTMDLSGVTLSSPFIHWATISGYDIKRGVYVDPFPQLGGRPVPVPNFGYSFENAMPADRIEIVDPPLGIPYYNSYIKNAP